MRDREAARRVEIGMKIKEFCERNGIPGDMADDVYLLLSKQRDVRLRRTLSGDFIIDESDEGAILALWHPYVEAKRRKAEAEARRRQEEDERRRAEEAARQEKRRRAEEASRQEEEFLRQEEKRVAAVARSMPITSTNGFEGYRIVEYGGYVSGDEAVELTGGYFGGSGDFDKDRVNNKIKSVRSVAIEELKLAAAQIGCNAVVGLDFDYVTIDRQHVSLGNNIVQNTFVILTANGTAVTIEPL